MTAKEKDPIEITTTTEMDTEYDVIEELKDSLDEIYKAIQESDISVPYEIIVVDNNSDEFRTSTDYEDSNQMDIVVSFYTLVSRIVSKRVVTAIIRSESNEAIDVGSALIYIGDENVCRNKNSHALNKGERRYSRHNRRNRSFSEATLSILE